MSCCMAGSAIICRTADCISGLSMS
jgi:hypothetical protein